MIKKGLQIGNNEYIRLIRWMIEELEGKDLLGFKFNNIVAKEKLKDVFRNMIYKYRITFDAISESWRSKYLAVIAQKYSYN